MSLVPQAYVVPRVYVVPSVPQAYVVPRVYVVPSVPQASIRGVVPQAYLAVVIEEDMGQGYPSQVMETDSKHHKYEAGGSLLKRLPFYFAHMPLPASLASTSICSR